MKALITHQEVAIMHTPGPWRRVRVETPEYYTDQIEVTGGHIASVTGWSDFGARCPITDPNARLIEHAPDMADAASPARMGGDDGGMGCALLGAGAPRPRSRHDSRRSLARRD